MGYIGLSNLKMTTNTQYYGLFIVFCCIAIQVNCAEDCREELLYPDLDCHAGYIGTAMDAAIALTMKDCIHKTNEDPCFKRCMLRKLGMLNKLNEMTAENILLGILRQTLFRLPGGDTSAMKISSYLSTTCRPILNQVVNEPCAKWVPFFRCTDMALTCKES